MEEKLITLAIHTTDKANILKQILNERGINVVLEKVGNDLQNNNQGFAIKINISDLNKALAIIEENRLFSYSDLQTYKIDDGRNRILVAVDFSDYSLQACYLAFNIAKETNAKVKILHVYHNLYYPSSLPFADTLKTEEDESLLDKARRKMLQLCTDIDKKISNEELPSVNYSYSIREGIVEEEIDSFIKEYKPLLLVVGTKGAGNNKNETLGSVTADIIEMTDTPVMAVPENSPIHKLSDIKHIAFLTNLQQSDLSSFNNFVNIMSVYKDLKVSLVHINRKNKQGDKWTEAELMGMQLYFEKQYPQLNVSYKLIDSPDMIDAIDEFIEKEDVSMVALYTRRRNIWGRIFSPSMSRKVLLNSNVSLLILRA